MSDRGRPTKYSTRLAEEICALLMQGYSLRKICDGRDGMPSKATICNWLAKNKEFLEQYARAREIQAEIMADEILDIADDGTNDYVEREVKGGTKVLVDYDNIQRSKLRVDARKWVAEKLLPKKFGTKKAIEHSGPDGAPLEAPCLEIEFVNGRLCERCEQWHDEDGPCPPPTTTLTEVA